MQVPWYCVSGFGAHIRATGSTLVVQQDGRSEEIPLAKVKHLMVMGGHSLHTSAVSRLLREGAYISFFAADGEPLGITRPFGGTLDREVHDAQHSVFGHSYAVAIARGALSARLLEIERLERMQGGNLLYEGELQILHQTMDELEFLVRVEEIRRVHRLTSDMYYEILSRTLPGSLGFRRRTGSPYLDVVNTILSVGYNMLFGNTAVAVLGAHLDPGYGFLHRGPKGLVYDVMDPFKSEMIDRPVLALIRDGLSEWEFECGETRCHISDGLRRRLTQIFHASIDQDMIDAQVMVLIEALQKKSEFYIVK
ncbi:CRISPR-associated endonuclease Cas1 [Methanolinea mesophila]|uniref:CRISPR-associated endonuclease Cas1 n=1 Tax=Methanolinea mesophila TaxID=547055 RepID=UPI001AE2BB66|nr:CRISPR-associated endonuclease Cas1 [Methanolinea mesophila]